MSAVPIAFDNSYLQLPLRFYHRQTASRTPDPALILLNTALADELGIDPDWLRSPEGVAVLSGNAVADGSDPIACVYAGHQFGNYNPQLGDGRALLLGEVIDTQGRRRDLQLKGSGPTPYSRGGDGKSPLGPVIREYLLSEAMHRLGVPTTRALSAMSTGDKVYRERALPGGILCRVASSHIRVGTVQYFAASNDEGALRQLLDYVIARHYPAAAEANYPYEQLLDDIIAAQAALIAHWQSLGFIHGVMNTDNMLLCGETIDYGPCAFMEAYHPGTVFSSIDHQGRYAFGNQPAIAQWNLVQLAQAILPILRREGESDLKPAVERAQNSLNAFTSQFFSAYRQHMASKLGLSHADEADEQRYQAFLQLLQDHDGDFTLSFRALRDRAAQIGGLTVNDAIDELFTLPAAFDDWFADWQQRLDQDSMSASERDSIMRRANPVFIPRNHQVEAAIAAAYQGDMEGFITLNRVLSQPFEYRPEWRDYALPAKDEERVDQTFCGT
ncbi:MULTISPECIES: protein adenylyltransferase SelO [Spongiibacter]|uniref:protein adenylyltransferase SelO n=1 Tax=Spongiibacter TaxID=630749 RepID=UPI001B272567|nr:MULTISPECIES: YdiU family protein [Spongiibacter]MBO6754347.1 YdiU family protein [Spongiibacter sp.]|tara:strand:- start:61905 stop:63404 length:1500 start_codon:yes stop_codon:yes gene_type:complete